MGRENSGLPGTTKAAWLNPLDGPGRVMGDEESAPSAVTDLLVAFSQRLRRLLGSDLVGTYVHGSLATGGFDQHSDIDFIVALRQEVTETKLSELQQVHADLYERESRWAQRLNGSYVPVSALRRYVHPPSRFYYLNTGGHVLAPKSNDDTVVVRWVLRERGIRLFGPPAIAIVDPISAEVLRRDVLRLMHSRASRVFALPEQANNGLAQPFAVLLFCRMLHSLVTGSVESKPAAVTWAARALGDPWGGLVQRALDARPDKFIKLTQPADAHDLELTFAFVRFALAFARTYEDALSANAADFDRNATCRQCNAVFVIPAAAAQRKDETSGTPDPEKCPHCKGLASNYFGGRACSTCGGAVRGDTHEQAGRVYCQDCFERRPLPGS